MLVSGTTVEGGEEREIGLSSVSFSALSELQARLIENWQPYKHEHSEL
jgi:hypothetical protein